MHEKKNTILVVDDEPQIQKMLSILLEVENFKMIESLSGKQTRIKDTKGCMYVRQLLANPKASYTATQLQAFADKPMLADEDYSSMSAEGLAEEGLTVSASSADEVLDPKALKDYRQSLKTIDEQIKEAEKKGMTEKVSRLKQQKAGIEQFLQKNTNIQGESRKMPNESEKIRQAVRGAIATVSKNLNKELPGLGKHLQASIKTGHTCTYAPEQPLLRWQV